MMSSLPNVMAGSRGYISNPPCFYGTLCHVCKACDGTNITLKRCGGCKMIAYCSSQHQKLHWPRHRQICKSVQNIIKGNQVESIFSMPNVAIGQLPSVEEWKRVRFNNMLLTEIIMKRKLIQEEREMFFFPRVCQVCREFKQERLHDCIHCHSVSYCSSSHQTLDKEKHGVLCSMLKISCRLDNSSISPAFNYIQLLMESSPIIPIQKCLIPLPLNMELFLQLFFPFKDSEVDIHIAKCSELLTWPLTLLYCLENIARENDHWSIKSAMVVHIVGASLAECSSLCVWEIILHWLPYLKYLRLVFVGPDVINWDNVNLKLCFDCIQDSKRVLIDFQSGILYKDYFKSSSFTKPDLVVAYNCGFHEYENSTDASKDTWASSIPYMLNFPKTSLLITSYTVSEAESDISRVVQYVNQTVNILMSCQHNPYCSRRPYRDWEYNGSEVFFFNAFVSLLMASS